MSAAGRIVCGIALALAGAAAGAQPYPVKPIRFIVPYAAGGGADAMARMVSPRLAAALGQQVVVENRAGAGGNIGSEAAARAAPDGYTMLMGAAALAVNVSLYPKLAFDPVKDFVAVTLLAKSPNIVAVHPSLPANSIKQLIAVARARPGEINYASGGSGTTLHLAAELFKSMAQVNIVHVPYKSTAPAMVALLSGEVSLVIGPALAVLPHARSGRLRALAITSATRSRTVPELPTAAESGLPGFEVAQWYGALLPAGSPNAAVKRLNDELTGIVRAPALVQQLEAEGSIPAGGTPQEFAAYLNEEITRWAKVVKASGAKVE